MNTNHLAPDGRATEYPLGQEIAHAATHGAGALLGMVALVLLVWRGVQANDPWSVVAGAIYGASLILLFSASSLYHALRPGRAKRVFQALDHAAIYLLIAGTYTPFALVTLRGPWGWSLLGIVWGLSAGGIVFEVLVRRRFLRRLSLALYLALGWLAVVVAVPLVRNLPAPGPLLLLVGGLIYSGGAGFYAARRLAWNHAIWHVLVLAAATVHFFCVYNCVIG
ncbi:MAG: hemolysin III family protein [bacterium]|nr:hemolysin III family protein [bacterium]